MIKKLIKITGPMDRADTVNFWASKTPEERLEALETIREHYYSMLGYTETPRIKRCIKIS